MTPMKNDKVIAYAKRSNNLFTLDLAVPSEIISAISKIIVITD